MWHVFVAPFPMDMDTALVRVGTTTDPLKKLHTLQADFPFPLTMPCYAPVSPDRQPASLVEALISDRAAPFAIKRAWLRCPLEWARALPALIGDLVREVAPGTYLHWHRPSRTTIQAQGLTAVARAALMADRTGVQKRTTPLGAERPGTGLSPFQQCYALLRDGRALSLNALLRLIEGPVAKTSLASQLSRSPDFRFIDPIGWVLASAQAAEQQRRAVPSSLDVHTP